MNKKWYFAIGTSALLLLAGCSNDTVATTSTGNITKDELYNAMVHTNGGQQALYSLLVEKVALANLKDKALVEKTTNDLITTRQAAAGGQEAFINLIKTYGYDSLDAFKKAAYNNQAILQVIKENIVVTDEEIATAYDTYDPKVTASHILVSDENLAKDIINQLNNGGDWNALASQHSIDTANKDKGGSLGEFNLSTMVKEFADAIRSMEEGTISKTPVKSSFGYHIIKLEKKPTKKSLDEEKETIKATLVETKAADSATQQSIMSKLLQNANVKINDAYLENALKPILSPQETQSSETTTSTSSNK